MIHYGSLLVFGSAGEGRGGVGSCLGDGAEGDAPPAATFVRLCCHTSPRDTSILVVGKPRSSAEKHVFLANSVVL